MAKTDIQIVIEADGKPIDAVIKSTEGLKEAMQKAISEATKLKPSLINAAASASLFQSLKSAVGSLQGIFASYTQSYEAAAVANTKLTTVMQERMNATAEDVKGVKDVISAQKELGVVSGSVQVAGAQQIGTFATQASTLRTLVPAMNNLLAQQKGVNATQEDAVTVGNLFGKALQGQVNALRRVGITFSESEKKMLQHGTESQRAAILAQVITNNVGEMNQKLASTPVGKMKQLQMYIGGVKAKIGELVYETGPYLAAASQVAVLASSFAQLRATLGGVWVAVSNFLLATKASILALYAEAGAAGATTVATKVLTAAKLAAVSAAKKLIAVMSSNIWLVAAAAVAALTYAIYKLVTAQSETEKQQQATNEAFGVAAAAASKEESKLKSLFDALNQAKQGTAAYAQAKNSIMEQYGEYIRQIQKEHGEIKDLAKMYDLLREKVVAAARARAMEAYVDKKMEGTAETRAELVKQLRGVLSTVFHGGNINKQLNEVLRNIDSGAKFSEHYVKQFDQVITSASPTATTSQRTFNPFRDAVQGLQALNKREKQIRADADAALGISPPPTSAGNKKVSQNKAYWENLKKSAQEDLEAKDMSSAKERKEAAELRKKIAYYDKQLEFYSASSHGGGKGGGGKGGKHNAHTPKKTDIAKQLKEEAEDAHALKQAQDKEQADAIKAQRERYVALAQADIDARKEGAENERAQNELDLKKELANISEQTAALVEAKRDQAEAVWNATHRAARDKGMHFDRSTVTVKDLSAEERDYFDEMKAAAREKYARKELEITHKHTVARLEELHTVNALSEAIEKLNTASEKQSGDEYYNTQKTISAYQRKLDALKSAAEWQTKLREIKEISSLGTREMRIRVRAMGIEEIQSRIEEFQKRLADKTNPVSPQQRKEMMEGLQTLYKWRRESIFSVDMVKRAWGSVSSIGNAVQSLSSALRGNSNAWQKLSAVINAVLQLHEGFKSVNEVMRIFGFLSKANKLEKQGEAAATLLNAQAVQTEAQTTIAAATAKTAANKAEATTNVAGAAAKTFNAHAAIPWVGIAAAAALTGVMIATMASLPKFAEGGIAYGPTLGLFGEYAGASHNPEVVAPLDRLRSLIAPQESGGGSVRFRIEGRDLVGILQKVHRHNGRN